MKIRCFDHLLIGNNEYEIKGSNYPGSTLVYRIQNVSDANDEFVIKIDSKQSDANRFEREISFLKQNKYHCFPKIVSDGWINYYDPDDIINSKKYRFFVMPKYEQSLTDFMNRKIGNKKRLNVFIQICKAVEKLHLQGIIHRDIKPDNILINKGRIIICDFGIAKLPNLNLTEKGDRLANSNYCAPEQRKKPYLPFGKFTDIYSLGLILNELFTGKIMNGSNYLHIRDVAPSYAILDDLVFSMTQNDYKKREDDLSSILYQIDQYSKERNNLEVTYRRLMQKSCNLARPNGIIKMLADDCVCLYYICKKTDDLSALNLNHHSNIHCKINDDFVRSMVVLCSIEHELDTFFNNGNKNVIENYKKEQKLDMCDNETYKDFEKLLNPFLLEQAEIESFRIRRKFLCMRSYRARKFLSRAEAIIKETTTHLNDSPIFYLADLINKYCGKTIIVSKIGHFVEPILKSSTTICEEPEIYYNRINDKILLKSRLLAVYGEKITVNISDYEFSIIFKSKTLFKSFVGMCRNYQQSLNPNDVLIVDVDDMLDYRDLYKGKIILYLLPSTMWVLPYVLDFNGK